MRERKKKGSHSVTRTEGKHIQEIFPTAGITQKYSLYSSGFLFSFFFIRSTLHVTLPFLPPACSLLNFYVFLPNTSAPLETDLTSVFPTFIPATFFDEINTHFLIGPPQKKKKKKKAQRCDQNSLTQQTVPQSRSDRQFCCC